MSSLISNPLDCSLVALRAFREAARSDNLTEAAKRVGVTQGAISHHIKFLEKQLQTVLFVRQGRKLSLTESGKILFGGVDEAFKCLEDSLQNLAHGTGKKRLIVGVLSSFAAKWLMPRLGAFYGECPQVELVLYSVNHTLNVEKENIDLAIVNLPLAPHSPKVASLPLYREKLLAVCSPDYLAKHPITAFADLGRHVLLHDETEIANERGFDWHAWLVHYDCPEVLTNAQARYFSQSELVLQAAIAGHGVALSRASIAAADLRDGLLVNPFPQAEMLTQSACYLCGLVQWWETDKVALFRNWLVAEIAADCSLAKTKGVPA